MLELTDGHRERINELQALADEAEGGDEGARRELRRAVRESAPEVIRQCSNTARTYRSILAKTASGGNPLVQEAISERARLIAEALMGEDPTPLEGLLAERVASLWVLVELHEALNAGQYNLENSDRIGAPYLLQMCRIQESAHRRYLAAIKTLAQVQRLRGPSRLQVNIGGQHVNVS